MDLFGESDVYTQDEAHEDDDLFPGGPAPSAREEGLLPPRESALCLGHEGVEQVLLGLYASGRMPHALIFSGPVGVGKATMAFRLARFLLKGAASEDASLFETSGPADASLYVPPTDPVFRRVASGGHPDLLSIALPEGKKELPVEDVRKVAPFLRMTASSGGGWRVVIVDDADTMSRSSQNAILKILEEPPPRTLLILVAHRLGAMIPTIRSRCRVVPFAPLSPEVLEGLLRRADPLAPREALELAAAMAEGSAGAALSYLRGGGPEMLGKIADILSGWPHADWARIHMLAEFVGGPGGEGMLPAFRGILGWALSQTLRARARGAQPPRALRFMDTAFSGQGIERLARTLESLHVHFETAERGNLDRRQTVLGAFMVLRA